MDPGSWIVCATHRAGSDYAVTEGALISAEKEPTLQVAASGDGRSTKCGAGHSDHGGHSPRDRQLRQKEVSSYHLPEN